MCIPSILQYIGHVSLQITDAVWGQYVFLSHMVQLGGEHECCRWFKKGKSDKSDPGSPYLRAS